MPDRGGLVEGRALALSPGLAVIPVYRWRQAASSIEAEPVAVIVSRQSGVTRLAVPGVEPGLSRRSPGDEELDEVTRLSLLESSLAGQNLTDRHASVALNSVKLAPTGESAAEGSGESAAEGSGESAGEGAGDGAAASPGIHTTIACRLVPAGDSVEIRVPG